MPTYEYQCEKCGKRFSVKQSIAEHGNVKVLCPKCKNRNVRQLITAFTAKTSRKS
jgi:putative FmdB family regulatory protein